MAAARAEARRKAILSRGTDRLARLTTSARGEDGGAHCNDFNTITIEFLSCSNIADSPLPNILTSPAPNTQSFLGEESSDMPTPASHARPLDRKVSGRMMTKTVTGTATSSTAEGDSFFESLSNSSTATGTPHNPSAWLPEQQQLFMQGRLHAAPSGNASLSGLSSSIGDPAGPIDPFAPPIDNPFASLMGFSGSGTEGTLPAGLQTLVQESKPKTSLQKALPLLHLVAVWCLLAYFLLWAEPKSYAQANSAILGDEKWNAAGLWMRWAELGKSDGLLKRGITTYRLQIVVRSVRNPCTPVLTSYISAFLLGLYDPRNYPAFSSYIRRFCKSSPFLFNSHLKEYLFFRTQFNHLRSSHSHFLIFHHPYHQLLLSRSNICKWVH